VSALLDTNVLIRHLTGIPRDQARRATAFLAGAEQLRLVDLVVAEAVYVLRSVYDAPRDQIAALLRAVIAYPSVVVDDVGVLLRTLALYQVERLDFVDAYLVAVAESTGIGAVASFDRTIDRVGTVTRIEP
jgi:predicted nucleic acid-binding protein